MAFNLSYLNILILWFISTSCSNVQDQVKTNGRLIGACEGCEAVFEYTAPVLDEIDTLPSFMGDKKIKVKGRIFESDGKTPADDVILYIYHT